MFSYIWRTGELAKVSEDVFKYEPTHLLPLIWIEHCVECAAPLCYATCQMYMARSDGRCIRFEKGVMPYGEQGGQISFRRWAKLEAVLPNRIVGVSQEKMQSVSRRINNTGYSFERAMRGITWNRHRPGKVVESLGSIYLSQHSFSKSISSLDGFLVSAYNHENEMLKGLMEIVEDGHPIFKKSIMLATGWNEVFIPMSEIVIDATKHSVVRFYLDGDSVGTITFRYLDFVALKNTEKNKELKPAEKVKCVAWDLDNTLWEGVIGDTKDGKVEVYPQSKALVEQLDKMGVIQTIVSKNTYEVAWERLEELELDRYFLYPAINWGRKSQNMMAIAKELNISVDTFALIDDSVFERNEVKSSLPQVRVYDVTEIGDLLNRSEFDVPVTEESRRRRESYQKEAKRKEILATYGNDYDVYLRDCAMHLEIFTPETDVQKSRCLELLQRSNQYNVSKDKRQADSFSTLFTRPQFQLFAFRVWDKWGDYGIVGFVSIEIEGTVHYVRDFVMSCRVAQKKVERAFFNWYVDGLQEGEVLDINVWKTERNGPLREALNGMPFQVAEDDGHHVHFVYRRNKQDFAKDDILSVTLVGGGKCLTESVLVIGGSHHNTLGVVRALGQRGYRVVLVTFGNIQERYVSSSKYVTRHYALETVDLISACLKERHSSILECKDVVISCADAVTEHLNIHKDELQWRYILPGHPIQGEMEHLMDKTVMMQMAAKHRLQSPRVWKLPDESDCVTFPLITKCHLSSHGCKSDVRVFKKIEPFRLFIEQNDGRLFAQQFIDKKEEVQFIGCSLNGGEHIIIPGMSYVLRSQPNTNTGFLEYEPVDDFWKETVERSKHYIRDCEYSGLFSIEFMRSQDDQVYFLEINFRNDGNAYCVTKAGVNLPVVWYKAATGETFNEEKREIKPVVVMPEFQDFKLVLQRKVGLRQWLNDVKRTDVFLDYDRQDMKPFWHFIAHRIPIVRKIA